MVLASIILALAFTCGNCWFYMHHYPFFHHHHHRFPPLFVSNCQDDGNCKMCLVNDVHWCLPCGTYKLCGGSNSGDTGTGQNDVGKKDQPITKKPPENKPQENKLQENKPQENKPQENKPQENKTRGYFKDFPITERSAITTEEEKEYIEATTKSKESAKKDYDSDEEDEDKKDNEKNEHIHDKESGLIYQKIKRAIACEKEISGRGTNVNEDRLGSAISGTSTTSKFGTVLLSKKDLGSRLSSNLLDSLHNGFKKGKSAADHCQEVKNLTEFEVVPAKPPIEFNSSSSSVIPQFSAGNDTD